MLTLVLVADVGPISSRAMPLMVYPCCATVTTAAKRGGQLPGVFARYTQPIRWQDLQHVSLRLEDAHKMWLQETRFHLIPAYFELLYVHSDYVQFNSSALLTVAYRGVVGASFGHATFFVIAPSLSLMRSVHTEGVLPIARVTGSGEW
eukprot:9502749-Pyramimonas_sp.AAC.1